MVGFMCKSAAIVGALLIIALAVCVQQIAIPLVKNMGVVVSGYTAKIACSAVFVQERTTESVANGELSGFPFHLVEFVVDGGNETVVATAPWGLGEQVAVYRDNFGCTLLQGYDGSYSRELTTPARPPVPLPTSDSGLGGRIDRDPTAPFPLGDATLTPARKAVMMTLDKDALEAAVEHAFTEYDPKHPIHTRAVVVVHRGQVVAERYAPPYTPMSRFAGWSMTKSLLSALIGIRIKHRRLDLHATGVLPEWVAQEGDPRAAITIDHLLRMSSGLDWEEAYAKTRVADVAHMLYAEPDTAKYAASKKLAYEPDTAFAYSSGTSNILSRILRNSFKGLGDDSEYEYWSMPHTELFSRLHMRSGIMETDASGTFVGSSYSHLMAKDWARFGLLYLWDGVYDGVSILAPGWVNYTRTPTPPSLKQTPGKKPYAYGAHWWLNSIVELTNGTRARAMPGVPADAFWAHGYEHQLVAVVPSRDLVVVRLGYTRGDKWWDMAGWMANVTAVFPDIPEADRSTGGILGDDEAHPRS